MNRRAALKLLGGGSLAVMAVFEAPLTFAQASPLCKDARAPIPARVADLIGRMTLPEKIAQIRAAWADKGKMLDGLAFDPAKASAAFPDGIGHVTRPSDERGVPGVADAAGGAAARGRTPRETVAFINALQKWAIEDTRLGIPVLLHEESLHGYMATEATMFPQAIALAGTFDTDLMRRVQSDIARETRARGLPYVLSAVVDVVRNPRWGRIEECFGEDPHLAEMGVTAVEGLQGAGKFDKLASDKVFATLKRRGHLFDDASPLFPFRRGLSYTTFDLSAPRLSARTIATDQTIEVVGDVTNAGNRAGDEVVQPYVSLPDRSVTTPLLALRGFERIAFAPGERRSVRFVLEPRHLTVWNRDMQEVVEPGPVVVSVGGSSASTKQAEFAIA